MATTTITKQLSDAVGARIGSLKSLRERISALLDPVPIGVRLYSDAMGDDHIRIVRVCTGASQWGNRTWVQTILGWAAVDADDLLICESLDSSIFDGSNRHTRSSEPTCLWDGGIGRELQWASGEHTRRLGAALPAAIAEYMAECEAERQANDATLTA